MVSTFERILRSVTTLVVCAMIAFGCWGMYRVYAAAMDRVQAVSNWIAKLEDIIGGHSKRLREIENATEKIKSTLDRYKPGTNDEINQPNKPTIRMYGSDGCGPCSDWWLNESDAWRNAGWTIEKCIDESGKPIPYWIIWDGSKWIEVKTRLNFDSYKQAGGN